MRKLVDLIEVRKIIALSFAGLFVFMVIANRVDAVVSMSLITLVIGYYFGKSTALDRPNKD